VCYPTQVRLFPLGRPRPRRSPDPAAPPSGRSLRLPRTASNSPFREPPVASLSKVRETSCRIPLSKREPPDAGRHARLNDGYPYGSTALIVVDDLRQGLPPTRLTCSAFPRRRPPNASVQSLVMLPRRSRRVKVVHQHHFVGVRLLHSPSDRRSATKGDDNTLHALCQGAWSNPCHRTCPLRAIPPCGLSQRGGILIALDWGVKAVFANFDRIDERWASAIYVKSAAPNL
jgi:hypothetical protein